MINEKLAVFSGADWFDTAQQFSEGKIIIGGAGGTGSWLSLFLTRNNLSVVLYDYDVVEKRNLGGQFFGEKDLGKLKINAISDNCNQFSNMYLVKPMRAKIMDSTYLPSDYPFFFSCFDNMEARKILFYFWKNFTVPINPNAIFIDLRLELELVQVYAVTPDRIEEYEKTLNIEDTEVTVCTVKQTTHNAAIIAGIATNMLLNHFVNLKYNDKIREVSFFTEYYSPLNMFTNVKK